MANESTNNAKKEKFIGLLHELFQLNQPELDFGLYRIMHAKSDQIKAFIKNDLAREIDEAFAYSGDDKIADLKANYEQARAQAVEFGIDDPDSNPKVKEAKEAYDAARDNGDDPSDIYDHLYRFFSRYYDKGDFLSRRYHVGENESRAAPYAVPYDGREVYLHWANKDQYYIKSSEYLSNFSFDLLEATEKERKRQGTVGQGGFNFGRDDAGNPINVTFQLVDAAEGAHNNVKENQTRFFILHADKPVEVRPLVSTEGGAEGYELIINFEYRPDPQKSGQESGWQKKRLQEAESIILEALKEDESLKQFHEALAFLAPTEKQKGRTLLAKYLTSYTARNTMDYFIHKDLGGFLRRELDFYIKNEIMRLDDLSSDDIVGVTHSLKKITALRSIARQIIDFLAQLENFQKKLWLKKKFVTEVNYCITLDLVPESFYKEILANQNQWQEWQRLGFIEEPTPSFELLQQQPYMTVDTGLFPEDFKERLLGEFDDAEELVNGTIINSDNFQALKFIKPKFFQSIDSVYLDPPYNTDASSILYKNDYKDSSWLSMINERLLEVSELMSPQAIVCMAIDDEESAVLKQVLNTHFEKDIGTAVVRSNPQSRKTKGALSPSHEYAFFYGKTCKAVPGSLELSDKRLARYPFTDDKGRFAWMNFIRTGSNDLRSDRPKLFYPIYVSKENVIRIPRMEWSKEQEEYLVKDKPNEDEEVVYPVKDTSDGSVLEKNWHRGHNRIIENPEEYRVRRDDAGKISIDFKTRMDETALPSTWWDESEYASANYGASELKNLFDNKPFDFPKAKRLVKDCLKVAGADRKKSIIMDFFAGSATTGHAILDMERDDNNGRSYILVEMGNHFDTIVKPRLQKVIFCSDWRLGKPRKTKDGTYDGISHCFKYLRLESYEDSLNNLAIVNDEHRESFLSGHDNAELRKEFYLNYFLETGTRGSASLINIEQFKDPTSYSLKLKKPGADTQVPTKVDLLETFNWLIGLEVALMDKPRTYDAEFEREHDPELPEDQHTRLKVKRFKEDEQGSHWFRVVEGYIPRTHGNDANKDRVMVIWRKLTDDPEQDAAALEALLSKYRVNQADSEYDKIYINGPHGLTLSGQAKAKLLSLEETFMARMWEDTDGAMH